MYTTTSPAKALAKNAILIGGIVFTFFLIVASGKLFEYVSSEQIVVFQDPIDGDRRVVRTAGMKWQGWADIEAYDKSRQFEAIGDRALRIRFNDGGHAVLHTKFRWDMPASDAHVLRLHELFGGQNNIEQDLIRPAIERAVYMTGPLMSSAESYSARRPELINFITDQTLFGVYVTRARNEVQTDELTGEEKTVAVVDLIRSEDSPSMYARQEKSPVSELGLTMSNLAINEITYNEQVETQIETQRKMIMEVQTAIAASRRAEQEAIRALKEGEAEAAKARAIAEVEKTKQVTAAEQRLAVAQLERQAAEETKQKDILLGQGEAERKRLVMAADGALDQKLNTWLEAQKVWASAYATAKNPSVPSIMFGAGGGPSNGLDAVQSLATMQMMAMAKQLDLQLQPR